MSAGFTTNVGKALRSKKCDAKHFSTERVFPPFAKSMRWEGPWELLHDRDTNGLTILEFLSTRAVAGP